MMFITLTAAQVLTLLTTVCPSEVKVLPESNTTIVYKCIANPELPPPVYPDIRYKNQSKVEPEKKEVGK
jgi:hypothetical protein